MDGQLWTVSCGFVLTVCLVVGLDGFFFFGQLVVVDGFLVARDVVSNVAGRLAVIVLFCSCFYDVAVCIFGGCVRCIFGGFAG